MPKLGMEPVRRDALVRATIAEIGQAGSLDVTVSQIARRAGMSSALAHHYFGGKDQIFLAGMREILRDYGQAVRERVAGAATPRQRLRAIIEAGFSAPNFSLPVIRAWMSFYGLAQTNPQARRMLRIYQARLRSNLTFAFRQVDRTPFPKLTAEATAAMIDGRYLRLMLREGEIDPAEEAGLILLALGMADRK